MLHVGTVEVSDDRVSSRVDGAPTPSFRQVEIEAKGPGSGPLLADLSHRLIRAGAKATTAAKLETVLGERLEPEVVIPQLGPGARGDVLISYALSGGARLIQDLKIPASAGGRAVRWRRVAARRLRSDLKTLSRISLRSNICAQELGWLGGLLGAVRDSTS
jgi:hypothetical protein